MNAQEQLIKEVQAVSAKLQAIEETNRAAWKARRIIDTAAEVLQNDWPKPAQPATQNPKPETRS